MTISTTSEEGLGSGRRPAAAGADQAHRPPEEADRGFDPGRSLRPVHRQGRQGAAPDRGRVRVRAPEEPKHAGTGRQERHREARARDRRPERGPADHGAQGRATTVRASEPARPARQPWGQRLRRAAARLRAARRAAARPAAPRRAGVGSGGHGPRTGGGSGSGASSKRSQKYLDCLSKAKQPADIEKCAKILEG